MFLLLPRRRRKIEEGDWDDVMYEEMSRNALFPEYYQPYRRHGTGVIVAQNKGFKKHRRRHGVVMVRVCFVQIVLFLLFGLRCLVISVVDHVLVWLRDCEGGMFLPRWQSRPQDNCHRSYFHQCHSMTNFCIQFWSWSILFLYLCFVIKSSLIPALKFVFTKLWV